MSLSELGELVMDREAWPGVLRFMGWQRVRHDWMTDLTDLKNVRVLGCICDGQGGLACCDSWGCKESDMTEWLSDWTELNWVCDVRTFCRVCLDECRILGATKTLHSQINQYIWKKKDLFGESWGTLELKNIHPVKRQEWCAWQRDLPQMQGPRDRKVLAAWWARRRVGCGRGGYMT